MWVLHGLSSFTHSSVITLHHTSFNNIKKMLVTLFQEPQGLCGKRSITNFFSASHMCTLQFTLHNAEALFFIKQLYTEKSIFFPFLLPLLFHSYMISHRCMAVICHDHWQTHWCSFFSTFSSFPSFLFSA